MKNFQQNLLIVLALALCVLCIFQWREQTIQRDAINTLNDMVYQKNIVIRDATNSVAMLNQKVNQLDASLMAIKESSVTNEQLMASQKAQITTLQFTNHNLTNELSEYQTAVAMFQSRLSEAYTNLEQQNQSFTNVLAQRDELARKYNEEVNDRNEVVAKYNDLARQAQKLEGNAKAP